MPFTGLFRSRAAPWVLALVLFIAIVSLLIILSESEDHVGRRWKHVASGPPSERFSQLLVPPPQDAPPLKAHATDWAKPHVSAYSIPTVKVPSPAPTLRDLADSGQAHAIDFLANGSTAAPHSWTDLQRALVNASETAPGEKDPFQFDRTLVATVTKGTNWEPGDRMVWTRVFIQPINFLFAGYTVAATENGTVKIESVEATSTRKFSADLGLPIPGPLGPKASLGPSDERTTKTTSDVNAHYEKLGIDIKPTFLRIIRESETGGDAVGNTTVSLSVVTDQHRIQGGHPGPDTNMKLQGGEVELLVTDVNIDGKHPDQPPIAVSPQAPVPHCPLLARVWMLYEERRIDRNRQYYAEAMQDVSLIRDVDEPVDMEIVAADDVSPAVWAIQVLPGDGNEPTFVKARVGRGPLRKLVFTDYAKASRLSHWFRINAEALLTSKAEAKLGELNFDYPPGASFVPFKDTKQNRCGQLGEQDEARNMR